MFYIYSLKWTNWKVSSQNKSMRKDFIIGYLISLISVKRFVSYFCLLAHLFVFSLGDFYHKAYEVKNWDLFRIDSLSPGVNQKSLKADQSTFEPIKHLRASACSESPAVEGPPALRAVLCQGFFYWLLCTVSFFNLHFRHTDALAGFTTGTMCRGLVSSWWPMSFNTRQVTPTRGEWLCMHKAPCARAEADRQGMTSCCAEFIIVWNVAWWCTVHLR